MPTPEKFSKNIILWVDDNPTNNIEYYKRVSIKTEIIPLVSTEMA